MPHKLGNDPADVTIVPDWVPPQIDPEYGQNRMNSRQLGGMARSALGKITRQMTDSNVQTLKKEIEQIGAGTPTLDARATYEEQVRGVSRLSSVTEEATDSNAAMFDSLHKLDRGAGDLSGTMDTAAGSLDNVDASMVTLQHSVPKVNVEMGTLEDKFLTVTQAADGLKNTIGRLPEDWALKFAPPPGGGSTERRRASAEARQTEPQTSRNASPPADLQEIFIDQFRQGHDMSGFRDAQHWWDAHLEHVAQLKAAGHAFAQGTAYAPGGLALVGEMGPELVNLPRGSQVIPQPRLGSEVTVNVTVQGSVVAERDLAQRIRQELIRTSRRTVDLGFS